MISFKFGLSLLLVTLVSRCFSLPLNSNETFETTTEIKDHHDRSLEEDFSSSPSTVTSDESHLDLKTESNGNKREWTPETPFSTFTTEKSDVQEARSFEESTKMETETSTVESIVINERRNHIEGHVDETITEQTSMKTETTPNELESSSMLPEDISMWTTAAPFERITDSPTPFVVDFEATTSGKYVGHFRDTDEHEHTEVKDETNLADKEQDGDRKSKLLKLDSQYVMPHKVGGMPGKFHDLPWKQETSEVVDDKVHDDSETSKAEYDPIGTELAVTLSNNRMFYDKNSVSVVDRPTEPKDSVKTDELKPNSKVSTLDDAKEMTNSLDQGKDSSVIEEKESNH